MCACAQMLGEKTEYKQQLSRQIVNGSQMHRIHSDLFFEYV